MIPVTRIWLVDDDPIFVHLTKLMIGKMPFAGKIEVFGNGQLALDQLHRVSEEMGDLPQVIFLDLMMPVLDGWGFLDEYMELADSIKQNISLYILSSSVSPQDVKRANKNQDVIGFISKPITKAKYFEIVGGIVAE